MGGGGGGGGGMDTEIRVSTEYLPWEIIFLQKALLKWRLPELCLVFSDETETAETGNLTQRLRKGSVAMERDPLSGSSAAWGLSVLLLGHPGQRPDRPDRYRCWKGRYG